MQLTIGRDSRHPRVLIRVAVEPKPLQWPPQKPEVARVQQTPRSSILERSEEHAGGGVGGQHSAVAAGHVADECAVVEEHADDSGLDRTDLAGVGALVHAQHGAVGSRHVRDSAVAHVQLACEWKEERFSARLNKMNVGRC